MAFAKATTPTEAGDSIYAATNGVYVYREKNVSSKYQNIRYKGNTPVFNKDQSIGIYLGEAAEVGGQTWFKVLFTNKYKQNILKGIGGILFGPIGAIPLNKTEELEGWVIGTQISETTEAEIKEQEDKETQKKLIDSLSDGGDKATAASKDTASNSSVYWILGIVMASILGVGAWLTFRKKKVNKPKKIR